MKDTVEHEIWKDPDGLTSVCIANERGDDFRKLLAPGSKVIYSFYASSHYEAMSLYYKFMNWGIYKTEFESDKEPYK